MNDHGFGEILDLWEQNLQGKNQNRQKKDQELVFQTLVEEYLPDEKVVEVKGDIKVPITQGKLKELPIEATLDLHGMTVNQAEAAALSFIKVCKSKKMKKILFIHGKGNHSKNGAVLKTWLLTFLEEQPSAGARGVGDKKNGGAGALWVILK